MKSRCADVLVRRVGMLKEGSQCECECQFSGKHREMLAIGIETASSTASLRSRGDIVDSPPRQNQIDFIGIAKINIKRSQTYMKKAPILILFLFLASCHGTRPANIGITDGKLLACPGSNNCVNSQALDSDSHFIAPLTYSVSKEVAMKQLLILIEQMSKTEIIISKENYLHVEFTIPFFGFRDDVEFFFPEGESIIHVRSASRLGNGDLGANRKRVEKIRTELISSL